MITFIRNVLCFVVVVGLLFVSGVLANQTFDAEFTEVSLVETSTNGTAQLLGSTSVSTAGDGSDGFEIWFTIGKGGFEYTGCVSDVMTSLTNAQLEYSTDGADTWFTATSNTCILATDFRYIVPAGYAAQSFDVSYRISASPQTTLDDLCVDTVVRTDSSQIAIETVCKDTTITQVSNVNINEGYARSRSTESAEHHQLGYQFSIGAGAIHPVLLLDAGPELGCLREVEYREYNTNGLTADIQVIDDQGNSSPWSGSTCISVHAVKFLFSNPSEEKFGDVLLTFEGGGTITNSICYEGLISADNAQYIEDSTACVQATPTELGIIETTSEYRTLNGNPPIQRIFRFVLEGGTIANANTVFTARLPQGVGCLDEIVKPDGFAQMEYSNDNRQTWSAQSNSQCVQATDVRVLFGPESFNADGLLEVSLVDDRIDAPRTEVAYCVEGVLSADGAQYVEAEACTVQFPFTGTNTPTNSPSNRGGGKKSSITHNPRAVSSIVVEQPEEIIETVEVAPEPVILLPESMEPEQLLQTGEEGQEDTAVEETVLYPLSDKDSEQLRAFKIAANIGLTSQSLEDANLDAPMLRYELAKVMVNQLLGVEGRDFVMNPVCRAGVYADSALMDAETRAYVTAACSLGIMGWKNDKSGTITSFDLYSPVTRAEFAAVLSRHMHGTMFDEAPMLTHLYTLASKGYFNDISTPNLAVSRGDAFVVLSRVNELLNQ